MKTILSIFILALSFNTYANNFVSEPLCFAPDKPLIFSPNRYIERYNRDIVDYKECIERFIKDQEQAISIHEKSIEKAKQLLKIHVN